MARAPIYVTAPAQGAMSVTIYKSDNTNAAVAFTTETGSTAHTQPVTVAAGTTTAFWVAEGYYYVSAINSTVEYAKSYGTRWQGYVENNGQNVITAIPAGAGSGGSSSAQLVQGSVVGAYYTAIGPAEAWTSVTGVLNQVYYTPIYLNAGTLDRIAQQHLGSATASEVLRMGIYADSGRGAPGTRLFDAGTIDLSTATALKPITISQAVTAGLYWLAVARQGPTTTATIAGYKDNANHRAQSVVMPSMAPGGTLLYEGVSAWRETGVTGALPATATPASTGVTSSSLDVLTCFVRYS